MAIFNSYVKLPEGNSNIRAKTGLIYIIGGVGYRDLDNHFRRGVWHGQSPQMGLKKHMAIEVSWFIAAISRTIDSRIQLQLYDVVYTELWMNLKLWGALCGSSIAFKWVLSKNRSEMLLYDVI